jgi:hypothetical protein
MKGTYCHLINPTLSLLTWIILGSLHLLCQVVCGVHQSMTLTSISPLTYRPTALPSLSYANSYLDLLSAFAFSAGLTETLSTL